MLTRIATLVLVLVVMVPAGCEMESIGTPDGSSPSSAIAAGPPQSETANAEGRDIDADVVSEKTLKPATKRTPLRPGAKTLALARAGDRPYDKTFDDIRFDIQPGQPFQRQMLPEPIEALAGQRIRIRGYMLPTSQKRGIREFVLVRDNQECCFGPGAALYDCILVHMEPGSAAEYSVRPVAVEGIFGIDEVKAGDMHLAIYRLDADSVQ